MAWFSIILAGFGFSAWAQGPDIYDVTHLARDNGLRLVGGEFVELPLNWKGRLEFHDLKPRANWTHPAEIRWIQDGAAVRVWSVNRPPVGWIGKPLPPVTFQIQPGAHPVKDPSRYWTLLLNGHASERHWNDFSFLYRVLTGVYGYDPQQILVADSVYGTRKPDLDGNGTPDILHGSTEAAVKAVFGELSRRMKPGDRLLLVVNDHGNFQAGTSTILLYDAEIPPSRMAQWLARLPEHERVAVFGQCHSGGFVRPTLSKTGISLAASLDLEISWARIVPVFDEFLYHWISAVGGQLPDGTPVRSDGDGDGRISLREAFTYALGADMAPESPFMEAWENSGFGRKWTLGD